MKIKLLLLISIISLSSCTSIYMSKSQDAAEDVVRSLNSGESELPMEMSTVPFIFDGEIVIANSSVSRIWNGLVGAGFTVTNPVVTSISPVISDDYALFRSSWEMEVFFENRIPKYTYKVTIEGVSGEVLLLMNRDEDRNYRVVGLKADAK
jgi:hypothetical protein